MTAFNHILVPTDFSEISDDIIDAGLMLARKFDAPLTLMHAFFIYPLAYANGFYVPIEEVRREAQNTMDAAITKLKAAYPKADAVLVYGDPRDEILRVAKSCQADLIVMGTHGRRGLSRLFLGSVAERVVRLSPIPVLTVSAPHGARAEEPIPPARQKDTSVSGGATAAARSADKLGA